MKEEWRDISGFEGLYQVSNLGRVRSLDRVVGGKCDSKRFLKGRILKTCKITHGYLGVNFRQNGTHKNAIVHRLVAIAFIPNPENKPEVNHINGIKTDNRVENLEWNTHSENNQHAYDNGLKKQKRGTEHPRAKLTAEQVKQIRTEYIPYSSEYGTNALSRKYGVTQKLIHLTVNNKTYKNIK